MRVFLSGTSLLPSYSGPAFSVSRLALALAEAGAEVGIWAPDQSAATTPLLPECSSIQRLTGTAIESLDVFGRADVLHDNGIWMPHNHRLANLSAHRGIPRLVSTRGMLEPWAINHKPWKKGIAWALYQRRDLKYAQRHHASSVTEARSLERFGLGVPVNVIPNGMDLPDVSSKLATLTKRGACRKALFLGRIHPVKGLPILVKAWGQLRPRGWTLQLAGPDEGGHLEQVRSQVVRDGLEEVVSFLGPLFGQAKQSAFFEANLFVLPTYSESFGMVIAEALAHGLPVLTTTGAPWPMLPDHGCGWQVNATVDGLAEGLRQATSLESGALQAMGAKGRQLVATELSWSRVATDFMAVYEGLRADVNI